MAYNAPHQPSLYILQLDLVGHHLAYIPFTRLVSNARFSRPHGGTREDECSFSEDSFAVCLCIYWATKVCIYWYHIIYRVSKKNDIANATVFAVLFI